MPSNEDDDELPSADPEIRLAYEQALGSFLLIFNEVDFRLSAVIEREMADRNLASLGEHLCRKRPFNERLETFSAIGRTTPRFTDVDIDRLRALSNDRNTLAHGYFDQNPIDGTYEIIAREKACKYPTERIEKLTLELVELEFSMRTIECWYDFKNAPLIEQPAADSATVT